MNIIRYVSLVVMLFCGYQLFTYVQSYKEVERELDALAETELQALQRTYEDAVGWLTLDGTRIHNPVMQTTNNTYYLTHNYMGEESRGGAIFADYRIKPMQDRHTILYGHVLRNETMFGSLAKFADLQYAKEHRYFTYETIEETYTLEVFAAYATTTDVYYIETTFTDETYASFLEEIASRSVIDLDVEVDIDDRIVTLSTCTTSLNDTERFVVHAKLIKR